MDVKATVHLGVMPPLSGLVALYGAEICNAARIACQEVNERGGVLGRPLALFIEDDGSVPETAVPAANRLIDVFGCHAIIGNLLSSSRIAVAARVAEPRRIPYLNFSFYEGSIFGRYFFNFAALPNQQIDKMIPYMMDHFGPKMYFAGNNYEWPIGSIDAAKKSLLAIGGEVVGEEYFPIGTSDFSGLLSRVGNSGADVFVPYAAGYDQLALLAQFTGKRLKERMAVVMGHYDEAMVSKLLPNVREGLYSSNTYFMTVDTPQNREYLQRLAAMPGISGIWPQGNGVLTNFGEGVYLCVKAFAKAVNIAGALDSEAIVDALKHIHVDGPQGRVHMDPVTHHASVNSYLSRCDSQGVFHIVERFGLIAPKIPARYCPGVAVEQGVQECRQFLSSAETSAGIDEGGTVNSSNISAGNAELESKPTTEGEIFRVADVAILAIDETSTIIHANENMCRQFGYPAEELIGLSLHLLLPPNLRGGHEASVRKFVESSDQHRSMGARSEIMGYRKDGTMFPAEATISKLKTATGQVLVATVRDISERKKIEEDWRWKATHDPLTNLPNRIQLEDRLANALGRSRRAGCAVGVMFVDLDNFKLINDNYGHVIGDRLLKEVGQLLVENVRPGDTVGRFGGDEYVVICEQIHDVNFITEIAERIVEVFKQPLYLDDIEIYMTVSLGLALGGADDSTADGLFRRADAAMYHVKDRGRNNWANFNEQIGVLSKQNLDVANGLRRGLEKDEFRLVFQPIVDVSTYQIIGAEVLLRWDRPGDFIGPDVFIPIAEKNGFIINIGYWVFKQACKAQVTLTQWSGRNVSRTPFISVNLSARQFDNPGLVTTFETLLQESGADPNKMVLEITETSLAGDRDASLQALHKLADLGFSLAVDDFGTGYSSLSQLMHMPFDTLKVDRAFVNGIEKRGDNYAVTSAIIKMAHELSLRVTAEGVETMEQLQLLQRMGCDHAQGYYFHKPLSETDFYELLNGALIGVEQTK